MKFLGIILIILYSCEIGMCQVRQQAGKLNVNTAPGGIVQTMHLPIIETLGTIYLYDEWSLGNIYLKNQSVIKDVRLKYDIEKDQFELNHKGQVRVLAGVFVSHFEYRDAKGQWKYYDSDSSFPGLGQINAGFFERVVEGDPGLFLKLDIEIIKPSYVAALDVGERTARYVQNASFYLLLDQRILELPRKKKGFYGLFGESAEHIKQYVKANKINIKQREDLVQVVKFVQSELK